jgi:xylose isomerase
MLEVFRAGGFKDGGFNFDSKVRRQSTDAADLFYGHVGAIDVIAKGLLNAAALIEDGRLDALKKERYAGWDSEIGQTVAKGSLAEIADLVLAKNIDPKPKSGRQERLENLINRFC